MHLRHPHPTKKVGGTFLLRDNTVSIIQSIDPMTSQPSYNFIDSVTKRKRKGTRVQCTDTDSLKVVLMRFASRVFSDRDCDYIDNMTTLTTIRGT